MLVGEGQRSAGTRHSVLQVNARHCAEDDFSPQTMHRTCGMLGSICVVVVLGGVAWTSLLHPWPPCSLPSTIPSCPSQTTGHAPSQGPPEAVMAEARIAHAAPALGRDEARWVLSRDQSLQARRQEAGRPSATWRPSRTC